MKQKTWAAGPSGFVAAAIAVILVFLSAPSWGAPTFPPLTGRVVDGANVLSAQTETALTTKLADLETKTHHQLVIVTLKDLQGYDIAEYGYQLGRAWEVGRKGVNDGVLLIVAPQDRKVRIEVGYGLEPILTDALSNVILQERVLPKFRNGDIEGGIVDGADAIATQLSLDPTEAEQKVQAAARSAEQPEAHAIPVWVIFLIVGWIILSSRRGGGWRLARALPWMIFSSNWGGRGGSNGGGGFRGGGGSFGGGGSSGSW
ncbi:MAG: TPM domain-containing protein [Caulobacterales bacterium]